MIYAISCVHYAVMSAQTDEIFLQRMEPLHKEPAMAVVRQNTFAKPLIQVEFYPVRLPENDRMYETSDDNLDDLFDDIEDDYALVRCTI